MGDFLSEQDFNSIVIIRTGGITVGMVHECPYQAFLASRLQEELGEPEVEGKVKLRGEGGVEIWSHCMVWHRQDLPDFLSIIAGVYETKLNPIDFLGFEGILRRYIEVRKNAGEPVLPEYIRRTI